MSILEKVRRWVDGESGENILEKAAQDARNRPANSAEEFIVKLARAVEEVMQREMVSLPQGTTLIPPEYLIFLSNEDDKEWQGVKRKGLEQGLYHVLTERAREISGQKKLETKSFSVELRIDGTMEKGEVRVQHSWDEAESGKTGVLPRSKVAQELAKAADSISVAPTIQDADFPLETPAAMTNLTGASVYETVREIPVAPALESPEAADNGDNSDEFTVVHKRNTELYKLEIWLGGTRQNLVPVFAQEVAIGRGSQSKPVDIALKGDPEISRKHVSLNVDANGQYWLTSFGRNATFVGGKEVPVGQKVLVQPGETIAICSYLLRIMPK